MRKVLIQGGGLGDFDHILVERAIAEFRAGRGVRIAGPDNAILAFGVEGLSSELCVNIMSVAQGAARLALPAARLRRLGLDRQRPGVLAMPVIDKDRVDRLALDIDATIDAPVCDAPDLDLIAIELARLSLTCPAVLILPAPGDGMDANGFVEVPARAITSYRHGRVTLLTEVARAPVPLDGASNCEFVVFRGGEGLRDQIAVLVGRPDTAKPVLVRIHSACLTGDLFGSLKCDCGDQLRGTVKRMAAGEGGVVLYLDQEGRGNGIANKMKAYCLQADGFDTYDADEALGFGLDQRRFDFAAEMLRQLGIGRVRLLTNNPEKIAALEAAGITVDGHERTHGQLKPENRAYLSSKRDRAGHIIDIDALAARAPKRE